MKAYRRGLPADGKLFPEGSKIVKIEWTFKKNTVAPYFVNIPDTLKAVATIEKDSKRFRTRTDGRTAILAMTPYLIRSRLTGPTPSADTRAIRRSRQRTIFSLHIRRGNRASRGQIAVRLTAFIEADVASVGRGSKSAFLKLLF
jgi:hypothetical protein